MITSKFTHPHSSSIRLNRELNGGAWCPAIQLNSQTSGQEWIQVNLTSHHVITKIATQGRFGNGMGVEYAESFWLNYTRDGLNWINWRNQDGEMVSCWPLTLLVESSVLFHVH